MNQVKPILVAQPTTRQRCAAGDHHAAGRRHLAILDEIAAIVPKRPICSNGVSISSPRSAMRRR